MTREELDRLRSDLTHRIVDTERIDALYDHIDSLEREANKCRKILVDALQENERLNKKAWTLDAMMEAYDTATQETDSE